MRKKKPQLVLLFMIHSSSASYSKLGTAQQNRSDTLIGNVDVIVDLHLSKRNTMCRNEIHRSIGDLFAFVSRGRVEETQRKYSAQMRHNRHERHI